MAKPGPPPESLLAALPPELSRGLFADAPKISIATDQTLFFAGEATNSEGNSATMHGAIATGYRAAEEVLIESRRRQAA